MGGAALVGGDGRLLGIGSLVIEESHNGRKVQGNMAVPIDLLDRYSTTCSSSPRQSPAASWLECTRWKPRQLVVAGPPTTAGGRAACVSAIWCSKWRQARHRARRSVSQGVEPGPAGTEIPLTLDATANLVSARLRSADRNDFLRKRNCTDRPHGQRDRTLCAQRSPETRGHAPVRTLGIVIRGQALEFRVVVAGSAGIAGASAARAAPETLR